VGRGGPFGGGVGRGGAGVVMAAVTWSVGAWERGCVGNGDIWFAEGFGIRLRLREWGC
jgi:hypothetical protein